MTDLLHDVDAPSDAELISRVRGGDVAAYGDLFARHVDAAKRLARQLVRGPDADDLVSDAFAKVLSVLQGGGGPDVAFRAYLLTAVRRLHVDKIRSGSRLQTSDDMEAFDAGVPFQDTAVAAFESGAAAKAFASLPERWQLVLWHLEVEGQKPADIAPLLGMSPNSVSALAYRAREGLRQAFLTMHLNDISETDCRWVNAHLGAYVRNGLAKRDSLKVRSHLDECRRCTAMYLELTEVNSNLAAIIAPLLLGAAATGYLASAGGAASGFGIGAVFGRVRDVVSANAGVATAGAVAAGVAAAATAGILLLPSSSSGPDTVVGADRPAQTVSTPPGAGGSDGPAAGKKDRKPSSEQSVAGPAGLLPSELPSTSESPGAVTVLDPGTAAGDGTTAGDGSTPGDTSNPPGDQTSNPSEPGPNQPGPSDPAPTEPGPTDPAPTQPAPTEPAPTQPAPTEPTPTQPTPTEPAPTEPVPITYVLEAGPATITNDQVSFDVTGTPELPPTVYLKIDSAPAGIVFSGDGTCKVRVGDATVAVCDTAPATAVASLARTLMAASGTSFPVTMPLGGNPTKTTDVTITLSAPEGKALQTVKTTYVVTPPAAGDAVLTLPGTVTTTDVHEYVVPATVSGVSADYHGGATFTMAANEERAWFVKTDGCTLSDQRTLTCTSIPADGTLPLHVYVKDNSKDTDVTITLTPLTGDDKPDNNTAGTTLKAVRPAVDVKLALTKSVAGNAGKATATATVTGVPAEGATLSVDFDQTGITFTKQPDSCRTGEGVLTCAVQDGESLPFDVALIERPSNFSTELVTFTATAPADYDETDASNNTGTVEVPRVQGNAGSSTTTTGSSSLLRTASDGASAGSGLVDQRAGSTPTPTATLRKTAAKVNLLSGTREQPPTKADAPAKKRAKHDAKGTKGKHEAKGHDRPTSAAHAKDATDTRKADKPKKSDPGSDKPSKAQAPGPGGQSDDPGSSDDPGNGGNGNGNGPGKKSDPGPVERIIGIVGGLLP